MSKLLVFPKLAPAPQYPCGPQVAKSNGFARFCTSWKMFQKV
jgi:hypothetical protein